MTESTIQLGREEDREALYNLVSRKISIFNTILTADNLSKDVREQVKLMIKGATKYKKFLSHKGSIVILTMRDLENIDDIVDYVVE